MVWCFDISYVFGIGKWTVALSKRNVSTISVEFSNNKKYSQNWLLQKSALWLSNGTEYQWNGFLSPFSGEDKSANYFE